MRKRLLVGLLAGGLLAAMLPGVVAADQGGQPNEHAVVITTPGGGGACGLHGFVDTVLGFDMKTTHERTINREDGYHTICHFGPDDIIAGEPPEGGYRGPLPSFPDDYIHVNAKGHGFVRIFFPHLP